MSVKNAPCSLIDRMGSGTPLHSSRAGTVVRLFANLSVWFVVHFVSRE